MLYSTTSLQNLCLITLMEHLDHYSPKFLAYLPTTLRRRLLLHLPIADVCELEKTCFFEDINAEEIWERLYDQHTPKYFTSLDGFPPQTMCSVREDLGRSQVTSKSRFLTVIANIILARARPSGFFALHRGEYCDRPPNSILAIAPSDIVNCLIAGVKLSPYLVEDRHTLEEAEVNSDAHVRALTDYDSDLPDRYKEDFEHSFKVGKVQHFLSYDAYKETNEKFQYFPSRHSSYVSESSNCRLSDEDAIVLLLDKCNFHPDNFLISASTYSSKEWDQGLVGQFFSQIVSLTLLFDRHVKGVAEMKQILLTVLSAPKPRLSSLKLQFLAYEAFFGDGNIVCDDHLALLEQLCCSVPSLLASPLQSLTVVGKVNDIGLNKLAAVVCNQPLLTSFSLVSYGTCFLFYPMVRCSPQFESALTLLFKNPNFREASLKKVCFLSSHLQNVITSYLNTPCTQHQTLKLNSIEVQDDKDVEEGCAKQNLAISELPLQSKSLEMSIEYASSSELFSWFFIEQSFKLKSLSVVCDYHYNFFGRSSNTKGHIDFLPIIAQYVGFRVESLSLCIPKRISAAAMSTLLKMDTLKRLKLKYCNSYISFDDLADNLLLQMPDRMLEELTVEGKCKSDDVAEPTPSCKHFCDVMFSMPQLQNLSLKLSLNCFSTFAGIMEVMYGSWQKNSQGRKPKQLVLCLPDLDVAEEWGTRANEMGLLVVRQQQLNKSALFPITPVNL